jgi:beta-galactosidase
VTLFPIPDTHLSDLTIRTESLSDKDAKMTFYFQIASFKSKKIKGTYIKADILDSHDMHVASLNIPVNKDGLSHNEINIQQPHPWTAETPYLYKLKLTLSKDGKFGTIHHSAIWYQTHDN